MQQQCTTALKNAKKKFFNQKILFKSKKSDLNQKNLIFRFFLNHDFFQPWYDDEMMTDRNWPVAVWLESTCHPLTERWTAWAPGEERSRSCAACDACGRAEWTSMTHNHDAAAAVAAPSVTCPATQPHRPLSTLYLQARKRTCSCSLRNSKHQRLDT